MWKASWIILIVFLALAFLDFFSTFSVGELKHYLEANPIYIITNSWLLLIALNLLAVWILLKAYDHHFALNRFLSCNVFIWLSAIRISTIISNFKTVAMVKSGELTAEIVKAVPDAVKISNYSNYILLSLYLPMVLTLLVFLLFRLDNKIVRNENGMVS